MKALTLTQPWASLVQCEAKRFETRSWGTRYRGEIAIHSAKAFPGDAAALVEQPPFARELRCGWKDLPTGCVLAVCTLIDVARIEGVMPSWFTERMLSAPYERSFGDYTPGRYVWRLGLVRVVPAVPWRGALSLWELPDDFEEIARGRRP